MRKNLGFIVSGIIGGFISFGLLKYTISTTPPLPVQVEQVVPVSLSSTTATIPVDFVAASSASMSAVVHITAIHQQAKQANNPALSDPFFREFFGDRFQFDQSPQQEQVGGTGSGVILSKDGYIVTNNHVIEGADEIEITTYDKRKLKAAIIGTDPSTDIAVLKVEATDLPFIEVADSEKVKVGEWVLAVGNPFNLSSTVTAGIVSAKGRNIRIIKDQYGIESFIQTDAAVNPGNSGGALVNTKGQLVGINTAIASQTGSYTGYSFAVPSNLMTKVVDDLITYGSTQRGFLGIRIVNLYDLPENEKKERNIYINEGVYIDEVIDGGAAKSAGLLSGDVIVQIEGKDVKSAPELQSAVGQKRPGDDVNMKVFRNGAIKEIKVKLKKAS